MRIEIYEAKDGWRWRLKAANHRIVAESGEAYASRRNVKRAVALLQHPIFWYAVPVREVTR